MLENDTAAFEALLTGFWALEQTRVANGVQAPLTWSDLRSAVSSYFEAFGQPELALPVGLPFLMVSAAGSVGVDLEFSRFSIVARHHSVRAWGVAGAGETVGGAVAPDAGMTFFAPSAGSSAPPASSSSASASVRDVAEPPAAPEALTGPEDSLLSAETLVTGPSGRPQGRNWTGRPVGRVQPGTVRVIEDRPGVAPKVVSAGPAPWPGTAYVVAADGADGRVRLPDGRVLDGEGLAAALAADPELAKLPEDVPVVLAVPFAGQQYQETLLLVAHRLGRTVWGASGVAGLVLDESGNAHVPVLMDLDPDAPVGVWVKVLPPAAPVRHVDRTWTALDGTVFHDSDVDTRPLADETHERLGRLAVPQNDGLRRREQHFRRFREMRRLRHWTPAGAGASYHEGDEEPVSLDAAVYVFAAHGLPGRMALPLRDGRTVWLGKRDAAAYIAGLPEVRELPPGYLMHLEICWSASDGDPHTEQAPFAPVPHVDDPLGEVSLDQHVSNLSLKDSDGATRPTGLDEVRRVTTDAANGERGRRVRNRPEPLEHGLDQLARDVGLHHGTGAVPSEVRDAALRLVRALRRVFGNEIENDRGVPGGRYERVLKGIGALERMRANDPALSAFTPFRMDLLDFYVQEHTGKAPDLRGYATFLDFAASRVAADPTARLTDVVPSPALQITLRHLADKREQAIRHVQSLSASAAVTPRHVASTLWAAARAAQVFRRLTPTGREAMGRKVLHLDSTTTWDRSQQEALWAVTAKAIAEGVDVTDHDLLAAYHLKEAGAFGPAAVLRQGPNVQGVNWSGTPAPAGVDWSTVRRMTSGPDGAALSSVEPDWTGPGKPMPMLTLIEVDQAGTIVLHLPGRTPVPVPEREFLALLDMSPATRTAALGIPVLFLTTGPGALSPQLLQTFSQNTGRPAYGYSAPMLLTDTGPAVPLHILALPDPATGAAGHWTAATRKPSTPATTLGRPVLFGPTTTTLPTTRPADPLQDPDTVLRDGSGAVRGRDLSGEVIIKVRVDRVRVVMGGRFAPEVWEPDQPAPWGGDAYVVGDLTFDEDPAALEAFAELLAADPELARKPQHVPVVLAIPYAGSQYLDLMRAVAVRLGRRVWAPSGHGSLRYDSGLDAHVPTMTVRDPEDWHGDWVPFDAPAAPAPFEDREWVSEEGRRFRDSDVAVRPLVYDRRERFGSMSMKDNMAQREKLLRSYFDNRQLVHCVATHEGDRPVTTESFTPDRAVYVFYAHGLPGVLLLALRDGTTVRLNAADGGRYIGGLPEVRELPPGYRVVMDVCYSGSAGDPQGKLEEGRPVPRVEDPLQELPTAQRASNASQREVYWTSTVKGMGIGFFTIEDTPGGVIGRQGRARPEPLDGQLDQLARDAGLHTAPGAVPPEVRATTLLLVRALREVFGPVVEDDRGVPEGRYQRVLKGIGALETLRANDPGLRSLTPFRLDLWTFLARRVGGDTPDQAAYLTVLDAARKLVAQRPGARLGEMVPDTALTYAVEELSGADSMTLVQGALDLPDFMPASPNETARAFWATVAAADRILFRMSPAEQESLGRGVLHMADADPWTDDRIMELTLLATRAHARGLDIADPHLLAAYHLGELGAFAQVLTDGTEQTGYNWSGRPAPNGVDVDRWYARLKSGGDILTVPHPAQWKSTEPPGRTRVIWTGIDGGTVVVHLPGHSPLRIPDAELWALLDLAPLVTEAAVNVPVLFPMSEFAAGGAKRLQAFSDRTGRNAWGYTGPLDLVEDDLFGPLAVTALREEKLDQWTKTVWKARPVLTRSSSSVTTTAGAAPLWPTPSARQDSGVGTFHFAGSDTGEPESGERPGFAYPSAARINATPVSPAGPGNTSDGGTTGIRNASGDGPGWAVPSWRPAGSPGRVRFADMYRDREWRRRSVAMEFAYAQHLGRTGGLVDSVRDAVSRMRRELAARHGEDAARRAFFAPDAVPADAGAELDRLMALPPGPLALDVLMGALTYASYAGTGLPREVAEALSLPAGIRARYALGSPYREVHDSRGMRRVGGEHGPALRLLRTYRALGATPGRLLALRDALIAWAVPADLQSLHEILRASHRLGLGTAGERELALRDGAGLHTWVADSAGAAGPARADRDGPFVPPHRALYAERMTFIGGNTRSGLALPDDLVKMVDAALAGDRLPNMDFPRVLVFEDWLSRHGDAGREALARLHPAHLTAVHLYGDADYRLMKAFLNGERFGAGLGRRLVRLTTWTMTRRMAPVGAAVLLPTMLRSQEGFDKLFDAMWDVDDLDASTPEVARLRRQLDAMADAVYEELPLHVDMTIEALEILPPLNGDVWWGDRGVPGALGAPPADGPVYGRDRITMPVFRSTASSREQALGFMHRRKGVPSDAHRGLVHVTRSTARDVSPFVALPAETEVLYPPGASWDIISRTVLAGDARTDPHEFIRAEEVTVSQQTPADTGRITELGTPDDLFGVRPPAAAADAGTRPAPLMRPVQGQDGQLIGVASFDDTDWAERQEQYSRLDRAQSFVSWERDAAGRLVASEQALPGGGTAEGTFWFASHGGDGLALVTGAGGVLRDDGTHVGRLLRGARDRGFRSVTGIPCGPRGVPLVEAEARAIARRVANGSGMPAHFPVGRVAVSDERPHLLEDADGRATYWVTEYPDSWTSPRVPAPGAGTRDEAFALVSRVAATDFDDDVQQGAVDEDVVPEALVARPTAFGYPSPGLSNVTGSVGDASPERGVAADADAAGRATWAVTAWQPVGAPDTPRFTGFYREHTWKRASVDWEDSLAEALSDVPELAETAGLALRGVYQRLAERNGDEAAGRAFFAPDAPPEDPLAELESLLHEPPGPEALDGRMRALVYAAYARPGLPRQVEEALSTNGARFTADSSRRTVHDSRGFRRVGGERDPALRLLRMFAELGLPSTELPVFRAAVAAWTISYDLQSLHEVLRASHLIGMGAADERAAATRDGAALHTWTVRRFTESGLLPREEDGRELAALTPPHQALYQERMSFPFERTGTMDVPDALVTMVDTALAGALPARLSPRLQVMAEWLEQYGERGAEALRRLTPAHITALYVYSAHDYRLMKALLNGERLGRGLSRHLVRFRSWHYLRESARAKKLDMPPLTLVSQPEFADLYKELTKLPDLDTPSRGLARLRRRADMMADRLHRELRLHIDMAVEALEILPSVEATAWWGERGAPGPIDRPALDGPVYGAGTIDVAFFRSTSLTAREAIEFALRDEAVPTGSHRKLVEVRNSTARDGTPFFKYLSEREALYPPGMRFDVVGRRLVETRGRPPMLHEVVEEANPLPDGLSGMPQADPLPYAPVLFEDSADDLFDLGPETDSDMSDAGLSETDGSFVSDARSDLGDDGSPAGAYPQRDYWNSPWEGHGTEEIVVQEIRENGRTVGKASFPRRDWEQRERFYGHLPKATHYTEWRRGPGQERVARRRPLPATTQSGTFLWASHGWRDVVGAAMVARLLAEVAAGGFTSITILACSPRVAELVARRTGLQVFFTPGRVAVTQGRDERGQPTADIHLLEAADGSPVTWQRVTPDSLAGMDRGLPVPGEAAAEPGTPADAPWSVPGWRVPGASEGVRFAGLYRDREWREESYRFERQLAQKLSQDPRVLRGAARAVSRLHHFLAERHGPLAADSAFFQGPEAGQWLAEPHAVHRFLQTARPLPHLIQVFRDAVYGDAAPVTLQRTLPDRIRTPRHPRRGPRQGAYRTAHDPRGFRYVGGVDGPALWLLDAYQAIKATEDELLNFRMALLSWSILSDHQSLHEVLRASQKLGVGYEDERDALAADGSRLHKLAGRVFGMGPVLPHHRVYDERTRFTSLYDVKVPQHIQQAFQAARMGARVRGEDLAERVAVAKRWLERFGEPGWRAVCALAPGHMTALFLYTSHDHELFKTYTSASRFGIAGRWLFRERIWKYVREDAVETGQGLPELLDSRDGLSQAISDLRDLDTERTDEGAQEVARDIRSRVNEIADKLYDDMAMHVDMAVEALEILPPVNGPIYWGGWLPGSLDAPAQDGPLLTATTLYIPRFRSTTEDWSAAHGFAQGDIGKIGDAQDRHAMVGYVARSTARQVAPFSAWIDEAEVLYPPGTAMSVVSREIETDGANAGSFADYEFQEMPAYPPRYLHNAEDSTTPRIVELTDDATTPETGDEATTPETTTPETTTPAPPDGYRRTGPYAAELDGTVFALHESPGEGDRTLATLLFALRYAAADALQRAGIDTAGDLRAWLDGVLTDDDVSGAEVPPLDANRNLPLSLLDEVGAPLGVSLRAEGMLLGDKLPASRVELGPARRLRVLLTDSSYGAEGAAVPMGPLAAAAARGLGVTVAVAGPDGEVTFHGDRTGAAPPALLVRDGARHLAGLADGPGDTTAGSGARLDRVVDALSSAPVSVLRPAAARQAPEWVLARIRYMAEAARFEERLGRYLGGNEAANTQLGVMTAELWTRAVAAGRWAELGSDDPTVDGVVGTSRDRLQAVAYSGNLRERMAMLWIGSRSPDGHGGLISDLLGSPDPNPEVITSEYRSSRPPAETMTAYQELSGRPDRTPEEQERLDRAGRALRIPLRPEDLSPPLSEAERALMPDGDIPWMPGMNRYDIAMSSAPQSEAEPRGALVRAGTSGSAYRLMAQAVKMRDAWGLDVDLGLVRIALMAEMLQGRHHTLDEIMRGTQLVLDRLRESGAAEPADLDYVDNWGRYRRLAPLTEAELREHVAVDGRFPDEHALDAAGLPADEGPPDPADPADAAVAEWSAAHQDVLDDVLAVLSALAPHALPAPDGDVLTTDLLERLADAWFRARDLTPAGSLADRLHRIMNDDRA
ncbi:lonely Cys domain-containing protein [Streptomyces sp. NPDC058735]|uniref:lonely Cys domain-containing protein n=1 Tax=Streptomyces sp. NPDC058735 TaxID=3346616 RepID=UPI0036B8C460